MPGSQPNNKPQWRPGGTKPSMGGKPNFSAAMPTVSSSSRRRGDNERGGFKNQQQQQYYPQQQYSKPWRVGQNNDSISEVGSVACSVMTPQLQDYNRRTPSEKLNEQSDVTTRKENNKDSIAQSNQKENAAVNEQEFQGVEENAKQILVSAKGGTDTCWKLNKQQIQYLANLGNEFIKISKTGIININQDVIKHLTNDPSIVTIVAILHTSKLEKKKLIFKTVLYIFIFLLLIVFFGALIVTLLVMYALVDGKLSVM